MKVKILQKCFTGFGGNMMVGEEHDLPDNTAEKLIKRGYAEAATAANQRLRQPRNPLDQSG